MKKAENLGTVVGGFSREKHLFFGGVATEEVLVTDKGKEVSLGCADPIGREIWAYCVRPAEVLDRAELEILSINGVPIEETKA